MISVNQDLAVNACEALIGSLAPYVLGGIGLAATSEAGPGGMVFGGGAGFYVGKIIDAITSGASGIYDSGRYTGSIENHLMIGYSPESGLILVYWP